MAPANGGFSDPTSRHFASVLSQVERAAQKAGASVTVHDASKPGHMLLGRGVLVAPARRAHKGSARTRRGGGGSHLPDNASGGPATANMVRCRDRCACPGVWGTRMCEFPLAGTEMRNAHTLHCFKFASAKDSKPNAVPEIPATSFFPFEFYGLDPPLIDASPIPTALKSSQFLHTPFPTNGCRTTFSSCRGKTRK